MSDTIGLRSAASPKLRSAAADVRDALLSALPPGVPPSFDRIVSARYEGSGRARRAVADLLMIDGRNATVAVQRIRWPGGIASWSHQWLRLDGGAIYWDGQRWRRDAP